MEKLRVDGNHYYITNKKTFNPTAIFPIKYLSKSHEFAFEMAFGKGHHRSKRSGGDFERNNLDIYINTLQGKLSEIAVYNEIIKLNAKNRLKMQDLDFSIYQEGSWDEFDIQFSNKIFSIKSTKHFGNLMLLETKDWDQNATYKHGQEIYDYHVLVRIHDHKTTNKLNKLNNKGDLKNSLYQIISSSNWTYDICGYISKDDLTKCIKNNFVLPKNSLLNGRIKMDAENYYIQSCDLRDFKSLIQSLS